MEPEGLETVGPELEEEKEMEHQLQDQVMEAEEPELVDEDLQELEEGQEELHSFVFVVLVQLVKNKVIKYG